MRSFVESKEIRKRYQIASDMDTVLLFNENTSRPIASVSMKDIPSTTLHHIISSNQYLALPRLSSQVDTLQFFDNYRPFKCHFLFRIYWILYVRVNGISPEKDCVWSLLRYLQVATIPIGKHLEFMHKLRLTVSTRLGSLIFTMINRSNLSIRLYQVRNTMCKWGQAFSFLFTEGKSVEPLLRIVILWRRDTSHVKYEWVEDKWQFEDTNLNDSTQKLENTISRLLRSSEALTYEAFVKVNLGSIKRKYFTI